MDGHIYGPIHGGRLARFDRGRLAGSDGRPAPNRAGRQTRAGRPPGAQTAPLRKSAQSGTPRFVLLGVASPTRWRTLPDTPAALPGTESAAPGSAARSAPFLERREDVGHVGELRVEWQVVLVVHRGAPDQLEGATERLDCALNAAVNAELLRANFLLRQDFGACSDQHKTRKDSLWFVVEQEEVGTDVLQLPFEVCN